MILNRMNLDNENENMKKKEKRKHDIEKDDDEEEEEEREEEEEEEAEENEDNHHKKMIKNKSMNSENDSITSLKSRIFYYKIFSIILAVLVVLIIIIILLSSSKSDNKELTSLANNNTNGTINENKPEKNNEIVVDSKVKDDLMNAYNNVKEINIIKFYEENVIKKNNTLFDISRFTNIHINIGFNENNINLIIEHLSSILYHSSQTTYIHIHMMGADTFSYESFIKLKNMVYKINNSTEVIVYNCANIATDFKIKEDSKDTFSKDYAKLCAFKVLKNIQKIIFLDADDCMVQKDLSELYNLDMNDVYGRGISEVVSMKTPSEWLDQYLYDKSHYINTGVILVNLELCQRDDFYGKAMELNNKEDFYTKTENPVQDLLNVLMRKKIEFFHPKYNKISFYENPEDKSDETKWYPWVVEALKIGERNNHFYTKEDLIEADNNPIIIHYAWDRYLYKTVDKYEKEKQFYCNLTRIHI